MDFCFVLIFAEGGTCKDGFVPAVEAHAVPLGCTNAQHSACSFQYFHWEQQHSTEAHCAVKASPARPVHNDYFFGFTMQNCPFFLLTVLQRGQERSCQAKGVRGKKKASCLCRAKLTVTACSAEGLFRYCCCFPSSQHGNGQCNELTASCCKVGSRKAP